MGKKNFVNPTDQARKEARKKELKKNKKQRALVRQAVIKGKDPKIIIAEMEGLDKMEYDYNNPPPYNAKVLQEKRRKLKESFQKIVQFYQREDPKMVGELKSILNDYEKRRLLQMEHYESVMKAQKVKVEEIPLPPDEPPLPGTAAYACIFSNQLIDPVTLAATAAATAGSVGVPLPANTETSCSVISAPPVITAVVPSKSILKQQTLKGDSKTPTKDKKLPPGPPPSSPPSLSEFECDEDEFELGLKVNEEFNPAEKPKKIRFNDETTSETTPKSKESKEEVTKKSLTPSKPLAAQPSSTILPPSLLIPPPPPPPTAGAAAGSMPPYSSHPYSLHPSLLAPPPPPPPPAASGSYMPKSGNTMVPPPVSYNTARSMQQSNRGQISQSSSYYHQSFSSASNTATAAASVSTSSSSSTATTGPQSTTIEAKPVLRNNIAEITRFVPSSVMVRRDAKKPGVPASNTMTNQQTRADPFDYLSDQQRYTKSNTYASGFHAPNDSRAQQQQKQFSNPTVTTVKSTDPTYESFMKEIGKLL